MFLTGLIFLPVLFALFLWILPLEKYSRHMTFAFSLIYFAFSCLLFWKFDPASAELQLVEKHPWIPSYGINYFIGIDGISFWLVLLTTFLLPVVVLASWTAIEEKVKGFHISLLLLTSTMVGTFLALDAILFYCFFEAALVPMYFMIGIWGGTRRIYATVKFFIFTMAGSIFMLVAIIALMTLTTAIGPMSASILDFYKLDIPFVAGEMFSTQTLLFFAFAVAFAIKCPMFPVHTWLPDAHVEAPTPGSVILAGVMLKMGTYGFMRFVIPMFPEATAYFGWFFILLAVIGIVYGALVAMVQPDMKKLVAYSSVSHMGYVILGLFALNTFGLTGGLYQMLNHGVSTGALFLLVGMIYERTHSREISKYGNLASHAPIFTILFVIVTMSSIAVPMTNGFVGEFLILMGAFQKAPIYVYVAVTGVVLGAVYMLWMVKKVFFGEDGELMKEDHGKLDIGAREIAVLVPLVILIFYMGLMPNHFLSYSKASIDHLEKNQKSYLLTTYGEAKTAVAEEAPAETTEEEK